MKKSKILSALKELNKELKKKKVRGEICLVGGAVNVSESLGLDNNFWINDAAKTFFSKKADFKESDYTMSNLTIKL
jgi:hypothetical protein